MRSDVPEPIYRRTPTVLQPVLAVADCHWSYVLTRASGPSVLVEPAGVPQVQGRKTNKFYHFYLLFTLLPRVPPLTELEKKSDHPQFPIGPTHKDFLDGKISPLITFQMKELLNYHNRLNFKRGSSISEYM